MWDDWTRIFYMPAWAMTQRLSPLMWANNETGGDFSRGRDCKKDCGKGHPVPHRCGPAAGKVPIDVSRVPIDMLSLSGHKIHAPKGVGVLYVKKGVKFHPFLKGGHQEGGRRAGTENTASIIGLGKACELAGIHLKEMDTRVKAMRDYLEAGLLEKIPSASVNGEKDHRLPIP